jgi:hypothetical protein
MRRPKSPGRLVITGSTWGSRPKRTPIQGPPPLAMMVSRSRAGVASIASENSLPNAPKSATR